MNCWQAWCNNYEHVCMKQHSTQVNEAGTILTARRNRKSTSDGHFSSFHSPLSMTDQV